VTIVTSRLDIGGAERHLARVLPALKQRGTDITLYAMERGGPLEAELQAQGVRLDGPPRAAFLHWPRATVALARFLKRERPTIIHFFLPRPYLYGSIAAELAGHRRRLMSRRSLTVYREKYPLLRGFELLLHRRTHGLIGNSRAVVDQLATEVSDPRKIALIHNGIDLPPPTTAADRERIRQLLDIPKDALVIAVIANLVSYKGHRDLLDALALVKEPMPKEQMPKPWLVLAIGRDDGMGAELKRHAAARNLASNIRWLGERPAADQLLAAGDIFVLPSHQEGFSNALLEAMAANLAVIATAVGGNLDAIVDNESGILVPPRDPSALAAALARLASDPDIRRRYGDAARRRVEQRFALERCVDRYERLYRAMCEPDPRPLAEILADDGGVSVRRPLEHDPEKRKPIFGKDHAQTMSSREMSIQPKIISL
jgi:glycosyltransferase involved in cell wall biosynthesis